MLGRTDLEAYTCWDFSSQSDGHPGAGDASFNGVTPARCAENLVRRYSRPGVLRADARAWPLRDESAALVVVDSPYSDNIVHSRDPRCLGRISCRDPRFIAEMSRVGREAGRVLRRGGVLVWIISYEYRGGVYTPVGFRLLSALEREFEILDTIALVRHHDRSASPMWEHRARRFNFFLRGFKFLLIVRKPVGDRGW